MSAPAGIGDGVRPAARDRACSTASTGRPETGGWDLLLGGMRRSLDLAMTLVGDRDHLSTIRHRARPAVAAHAWEIHRDLAPRLTVFLTTQ